MDKTIRDNSRRGANRTSIFLPLDKPLPEPPDGIRDRGDANSDTPDEDGADEEQKSEDEEKEDTFISIGVDFGTTYSGVAWSLSTSPRDVFIVSNWESDQPHNRDQEKVPSIVTYNTEGKLTSWGHSLERRRQHISWFKLGLSTEATDLLEKEQPDRFNRLQGLFLRYKKSPLDVSADYLRKLWEHATENIKRKLDPFLWENIRFKIVLTVPAIWDHRAQELTKKAAEMAGMLARKGTTLELIGEPEAAALAVSRDLNSPNPRSILKVGDPFVICDAGGGTVDLITYRIEQLNPLKLAMCAEATGGFCGAIFLDTAFEKQVRTMMSTEEYDALSVRSRRKMMNDWEHGIKRTFKMDAANNERWHVDIPGFAGVYPETSDISLNSSVLSLRSEPGTLVLKTGHLKAIFSEVCSKIKDLISTQLAVVDAREGKIPATILLVGGLGENQYLKQELDRSFGDDKARTPIRPWSAVCRGAVLKGLGYDVVVNHISKYNYGFAFYEPFDSKKHQREDRTYDELPGMWVARDQMEWFLAKGENVMKRTPVRHEYFFAVEHERELKKLPVRIYYSSSPKGETRITPGTHPSIAIIMGHKADFASDVKLLCTLDMRFPKKLFEDLPVRKNEKGIVWRKLVYALEMQVSSGQLCWVARHEGIEGGTVKIKVGYEGVMR